MAQNCQKSRGFIVQALDSLKPIWRYARESAKERMNNALFFPRYVDSNLTSYEISKNFLRDQLFSLAPENYDSMLSRSKFRSLRVGELRHLEHSMIRVMKDVIDDQLRRLCIESDHRARKWGAGGALGLICSLFSANQAHFPKFSPLPLLAKKIVRDLSALSSAFGLYRLYKPKPDLTRIQKCLEQLTVLGILLKRDIRALVAKKRAAKMKAIWKAHSLRAVSTSPAMMPSSSSEWICSTD